jgi:hypothetical protein
MHARGGTTIAMWVFKRRARRIEQSQYIGLKTAAGVAA